MAAKAGNVQMKGSAIPQVKPPPVGAPTSDTPAGRSSITDTFWAGLGPALLTVTERFTTAPGATGPGSQISVTDRSARAVTTVLSLASPHAPVAGMLLTSPL